MPDKKITDLVDGGAPQATDEFVIARAGDNFKVDWASLSALIDQAVILAPAASTRNVIVPTAANVVPLIVKAAAAQSVSLQRWERSDGFFPTQITKNGYIAALGDVGVLSNLGEFISALEGAVVFQFDGSTIIDTDTASAFAALRLRGAPANPRLLISSGTLPADGFFVASQVGLWYDDTNGAAKVMFKGKTANGTVVTWEIPAGIVYVQGGTDVALADGGTGASLVDPGADRIMFWDDSDSAVDWLEPGAGLTITGKTINAAAQSVQTGNLYASSNTFGTSSGTYNAGSISIAGSGAVSVAASNSGWVISAPAQSIQTQNAVNLTLSGNTAGALALVSSGTLTLAGGNNITVSQAGNAVTISGPNIGGAQTGISGISASDTLYTSGSVRFTGSNAVTVKSGTGQLVVIDAPVQSTQVETQTFVGGIAASNATYTSGTVAFTGVGGGVTVSSNTGQRVDISVAAPVAQTAQAGSVYASSNTFGTSSGTYDARTLSIAGSGAVSVAASNSGWVISAPTQSVQPQSNQAGSVYASSNTFGTSSGTYDARSLSIAGRGDISVAASNSGWIISGPTQTNQAGSLYASSNTFGTSSGTFDARTLSIAGSGNVSVAASNSGWVISVPASAAQTNQAGSVYASSNTFGTSSGTYDARSLSIAGSGAVSVAASNSGWVVSAPAQTVQTQGVLSAGVSNVGNTSGNTTVNTGSRLVFAGGNNITLSQGTAAGATTITISAPNLGAGAMSAGASNLGNTAGSTGVTGTQLVFVGSDNITLSQSTGVNGGTLSIIGGGGGGFSAGVSTGGNTAGDTGITGTRMVFVGTGPISLSQATAAAGGTLSINAPATSSLSGTGGIQISTNGSTISVGDGGRTMANWENMPAMDPVLYTHISGVSKTPFYWNENLPQGIKPANIAMRFSMVTANTDLSLSIHFGVYTFVNSTSAALLGSGSDAFHVSSASSVSLSAQRNFVLTSPGTVVAISSLSAGNYLFGCMFSATATNLMNASIYAASQAAGPRVGLILPGTNQLSTATSEGIAGLYGRGSTTVNAMPANVVASEVVNQGIGASSPMKPYIFIRS